MGLLAAAAPAALIVPELLLPKRTFFLPPAGGWWRSYRVREVKYYNILTDTFPLRWDAIFADGVQFNVVAVPAPTDDLLLNSRQAALRLLRDAAELHGGFSHHAARLPQFAGQWDGGRDQQPCARYVEVSPWT